MLNQRPLNPLISFQLTLFNSEYDALCASEKAENVLNNVWIVNAHGYLHPVITSDFSAYFRLISYWNHLFRYSGSFRIGEDWNLTKSELMKYSLNKF